MGLEKKNSADVDKKKAAAAERSRKYRAKLSKDPHRAAAMRLLDNKRKKNARNAQSDKKKDVDLEKNRDQHQLARSSQTFEEKEDRKKKDRENQQLARSSEIEDEVHRAIRQQQDLDRKHSSRESQTAEEKEEIKQKRSSSVFYLEAMVLLAEQEIFVIY